MARTLQPSILADTLAFAGGAAVAVIIVCSVYSFRFPAADPSFLITGVTRAASPGSPACHNDLHDVDDPPARTYFDDPSLRYTIETPIKDWDAKRRDWLRHHPSLAGGERVLMLSGSQPGPCRNPVGDHLLLRFLKNKQDYCRIHGLDFFYNNALLQPAMWGYWAKTPVVKAAMLSHPEAEWIWWVDSDAAITDMEFRLPLRRYRAHNMVVHGWPDLVAQGRSWTSLNAGVFLIRNCQWSLDFMDEWTRMGPQSPEHDQWGKTLTAQFPDKSLTDSDDQSGLIYLLLNKTANWADKVYLESQFYFEGYWVEIVGKLANISDTYLDIEKRSPELRRRRAEKVAASVGGKLREEHLKAEGIKTGIDGWRRPFITHFTGCQPCSGGHNMLYSGESCYQGMLRALDFADDQILRAYGFRHRRTAGNGNFTEVEPLPFDFPARM